MAHSNGIITAPVNTDDVAATLGVGSNDVGTLCSSDAVNPWAKYKPIKVEGDNPGSTFFDSQGNDNGLWRGVQGNGGIVIPDMVTEISKVGTAATQWTYDRQLDWFRITDFDRYDHKANCGYDGVSCSNQWKTWNILPKGISAGGRYDSEPVVVPIWHANQPLTLMQRPAITSANSIHLSDLITNTVTKEGFQVTLGNMYFGAVAFRSDGTAIGCLTSDVKGSSSVALAALPANTVYLATAYFSKSVGLTPNGGWPGSASGASILQLPGITRFKVRFGTLHEATGIKCELKAQRKDADRKVTWELKITNNSGRTYTTNAFKVGVYASESSNTRLAYIDVNSATVAPGATISSFTSGAQKKEILDITYPEGTSPQYIKLTDIELFNNMGTGIGLDFKEM